MDSGTDPESLLRLIAQQAPRLDEDFLAERLEEVADQWLRAGWTLQLSEIVDAVPLLRSRPLALDAAIDAAIRGYLRSQCSVTEAARKLKEDAPEFIRAIEAHLALRSFMDSGRTERPEDALPSQLPAPFGPLIDGDRQRYELVECIGRGSEGVVFRAFDRFLAADGRPTPVAIKRPHLDPDRAPRGTTAEAARAIRLRHPNIAALLDCGFAGGGPYLVYEFVEGVSLDRWRRARGSISPRAAVRLVRSLAEAVQAAHNAGIVHRDLKPNNILVTESDAPHITDFGLTQALHPDTEGVIGGSMGFAAPEQVRGSRGCADAPVDLYALGGILYWLLTGKYPNGQSRQEAHERLASGQPSALPELQQTRGRERTLYRICEKALAPNPQSRYASASLLAADLSRWLATEPVLPFDAAPHRRFGLAVRRSPLVAALAAAAIATVLGASGYGLKLNADHQRAAFQIERQRLENDLKAAEDLAAVRQERMDATRQLLTSFTRMSDVTRGESTDASWLPILTVIETLSGPELLAIPVDELGLTSSRLQVVENLLANADAEGTRDSIEMTLWETAHGYWLFADNQPEAARQVFDTNLERAKRVLPEYDPWFETITALREITVLRTEPNDSDRFRAAYRWLQRHWNDLPLAIQVHAENTLLRTLPPDAIRPNGERSE